MILYYNINYNINYSYLININTYYVFDDIRHSFSLSIIDKINIFKILTDYLIFNNIQFDMFKYKLKHTYNVKFKYAHENNNEYFNLYEYKDNVICSLLFNLIKFNNNKIIYIYFNKLNNKYIYKNYNFIENILTDFIYYKQIKHIKHIKYILYIKQFYYNIQNNIFDYFLKNIKQYTYLLYK